MARGLIECWEIVTLYLHRAKFQESKPEFKTCMVPSFVKDVLLCYRIEKTTVNTRVSSQTQQYNIIPLLATSFGH